MNEIELLATQDRSYNDYELYDCLTVCSNQLIATNNILKLSEWVPLSIRKGLHPRVWLTEAVEYDAQGRPTKFSDLIVNSEVRNSKVDLIDSVHGFQIKIDGDIVIEAGNHDGKNLEIIKMDLTIMNLNVKGDVHGLYVETTTMSRNRSKNSDTFIGLKNVDKDSNH